MTNDSIKTARLWMELKDMKNKLDNEMIPIAGYLRIEAPKLTKAMEEMSGEIENYFDSFSLVVQSEQTNKY